MEKLLPSAEVTEREEEEIEETEEDEDEEAEEEEDDDEDEGEEGDEGEDGRDEEEATAQATDKTEKFSPPAQSKEKKTSDVLNLNNEVVKMRKEVKRVRALIIRKLTRQIGALKKKKGNKEAVEKNQRRAARLLEEIHSMKALLPDQVTKTALQKDLNFEQVCKNPKSKISDRAIARIATHPQFNKKIVDIKAAVKAFKEERMKSIKKVGKEKVENKAGKVDHQSPDIRTERKSYKEEEENTLQLMNMPDNVEDVIVRDAEDSTVTKPEKDTGTATGSADTANVQWEEMPKSTIEKSTSTKSTEVKDAVKNEAQNKDAGKKLHPAVLEEREDKEESDLESSDEEEKQYFDDSTEERFHKQSSQSEESEDDDFFIGKVSKFKKKKRKGVEGEKRVEEGQEVKKDSSEKVKSIDKVQGDLDDLESRLKYKASSVFCLLSGSKESTSAGAGRARGGDKFRGQRKPYDGRGLKRDFNKKDKFEKQVAGAEKTSESKYSKPCPEGRQRESEKRGFASAGRGRGRGRGEAIRQKMHTGRDSFSHQAPQQALHPSWEASKKRKEQQGQILAFQGKKIKFDDDDD